MKKIGFILLFTLFALPGFGQIKSYSFSEVEKLHEIAPKPIVVFIHTSWCKYCKLMENCSFKNQEIIQMLNENFYFVSFDAEEKLDIQFLNHTFAFKPTGQNTGIHELAIELATINNEVVYPTITILGSNYSILFQKHSFTNEKELKAILRKLK